MLKKAVLAAVAVASIAGVASAAPAKPKPCHVPDVVGKTLQQARQSFCAREIVAGRQTARLRSRPLAADPARTHVAARGEGRPVPGPSREPPFQPLRRPNRRPPPHLCRYRLQHRLQPRRSSTARALSGQLRGGYPILIDAEVHDANGAPIPKHADHLDDLSRRAAVAELHGPGHRLTEAVNVPARDCADPSKPHTRATRRTRPAATRRP